MSLRATTMYTDYYYVDKTTKRHLFKSLIQLYESCKVLASLRSTGGPHSAST